MRSQHTSIDDSHVSSDMSVYTDVTHRYVPASRGFATIYISDIPYSFRALLTSQGTWFARCADEISLQKTFMNKGPACH